jgi:hypothetical protein
MKRKNFHTCDFCGKIRNGYMPLNKETHGFTCCMTCMAKGLKKANLANVRVSLGQKRYDPNKYPIKKPLKKVLIKRQDKEVGLSGEG